jgi:Tat protein translocase TatB subunit
MSPPLAFLNVGFEEMLVFGVVAVLVFGERLPQAMRNVGRTYARLRQSLQEVTRPVREELARADREFRRQISSATVMPPPNPPTPYALPAPTSGAPPATPPASRPLGETTPAPAPPPSLPPPAPPSRSYDDEPPPV